MKLLVIGGSGFLGRKIAERLISSDYEIFALVRSKDLSPVSGCNYIQLDETNTGQSISDLKFDVIINVAMKRSTRDNIVSEESLLLLNFTLPIQSIRKYSTPKTLVINTSTYIQNYFGEIGNTIESYGATKERLSKALKFESELGHFRVIDLYLFTLYGPGDRKSHLVPTLLDAFRNNSKLELSEGRQLINLLYVGDAVESIINALNLDVSGYTPFCMWLEEYYSVRDLVALLQGNFSFEPRVEWGAKQYSGHEMFEPWAMPFEQFPFLVSVTSLEKGLNYTYSCMLE